MKKQTDEDIIVEAKELFRQCQDYESLARQNFLDDIRFAEGDDKNMYQWPDNTLRVRTANNKPCPTVNKVRQHNLHILNQARANQTGIEIRAVGGGSTYKSAEIYEGIVRYIENRSQATNAYSTGVYGMVWGGIGWWRITTEYAEDEMYQDIKIERIPDPMSVYIDPHCTNYDKSDAKFGFVFKDIPKKQFKEEYPEHENVINLSALGDDTAYNWNTEDDIRVCEYYRKVSNPDTLHLLQDGSKIKESEAKKLGYWKQIQNRVIKSRSIETVTIEHFLIAGSEIIENSIWPGKYIPLVCCIGEETVIDGVMDRKGHTRALISPQRHFNYYNAAGVEHVALQTKTPYMAPVLAIEGYEKDWENANMENLTILAWNHIDDNGKPIPPPARIEAPIYAGAYLEGIKIADSQMFAASGLQEASFGEASNERSGKAINARQQQGENATYHYISHLSDAIRFTGRILIDLIPHIYDTHRIIKILGEDGTLNSVQISPQHPQAHNEVPGVDLDSIADPEQIAYIFNPNVGTYDVIADVGPSYATRRQDEFDTLLNLMGKVPQLANVFLDQLLLSADFPGADLLAKRARTLVPPQALGQGPSVQEQQLQQQLAAQHQVMVQQAREIQELQNKFILEVKQKQIDQQNADTNQFKAIAAADPEAAKLITREEISRMINAQANELIHAHRVENAISQQVINELNPQGDQTAQGGAPPNQLSQEQTPEQGQTNG